MSIGEMAYLTLVISAFMIFMAGVGFVSWYSRPKAAVVKSQMRPQVDHLHSVTKKAA